MTGRHRKRRLEVEELEERFVPATHSSNWAGYAVPTGHGAVREVSGGWVVPTVSGSGTAYSSFWVGIDGYTSSTVEQIGVDADVVNGVPQYYAWYDMYPRYMVGIPGLAIHPGDYMFARVSSLGGSRFRLRITDLTTGQSFATTQSAPHAQRNSAEWITESPSDDNGTLPLANFGTANFFAASVTLGSTPRPIDGTPYPAVPINLGSYTGAQAAPSALTDGPPGATPRRQTSSFTVTYTAPPVRTPGTPWWRQPTGFTERQPTPSLFPVISAASGGASPSLSPNTVPGSNVPGTATPALSATVAAPSQRTGTLRSSVVLPSTPPRPHQEQPSPEYAGHSLPALPAGLLVSDRPGTPGGETLGNTPGVVPLATELPPGLAGMWRQARDTCFIAGYWDTTDSRDVRSLEAPPPTLAEPTAQTGVGAALALTLGGAWGIVSQEVRERRRPGGTQPG